MNDVSWGTRQEKKSGDGAQELSFIDKLCCKTPPSTSGAGDTTARVEKFNNFTPFSNLNINSRR